MFGSKHSTFQAVVKAHSAELYRYAYWLCRDRCTAEDLVQETFARAWNAWGGLRDVRAARSWLYTIARREHARLFERKRLDTAEEQDLGATRICHWLRLPKAITGCTATGPGRG